MLFCAPSMKKNFFSPPPHFLFLTLLPPLPSLPITDHSHVKSFLSVLGHLGEGSGLLQEEGAGETDPEAGGQPPVNRLALLKPDRPRIKALESALRTWPEALRLIKTRRRRVTLLSVCLFITSVTFRCRGDVLEICENFKKNKRTGTFPCAEITDGLRRRRSQMIPAEHLC